MGIKVLDHLITEQGGYLSFKSAGILDELRRSQTWRIIHTHHNETQQLLRS